MATGGQCGTAGGLSGAAKPWRPFGGGHAYPTPETELDPQDLERGLMRRRQALHAAGRLPPGATLDPPQAAKPGRPDGTGGRSGGPEAAVVDFKSERERLQQGRAELEDKLEALQSRRLGLMVDLKQAVSVAAPPPPARRNSSALGEGSGAPEEAGGGAGALGERGWGGGGGSMLPPGPGHGRPGSAGVRSPRVESPKPLWAGAAGVAAGRLSGPPPPVHRPSLAPAAVSRKLSGGISAGSPHAFAGGGHGAWGGPDPRDLGHHGHAPVSPHVGRPHGHPHHGPPHHGHHGGAPHHGHHGGPPHMRGGAPHMRGPPGNPGPRGGGGMGPPHLSAVPPHLSGQGGGQSPRVGEGRGAGGPPHLPPHLQGQGSAGSPRTTNFHGQWPHGHPRGGR